ncbi:MAG: BtpA/SgcQ family protein [Bacteriovoracia bacterium]
MSSIQLIGVLHLPPLPGAPGFRLDNGGLSGIVERICEEARVLEKTRFDSLILENFGDTPFYKTNVPAETIASMAIVAQAVRSAVKLPLGINVLRNDGRAALGIAAACGARFIRVNVLSGVAATDQGIIEGNAAELMREKQRLCPDVQVLADVHVKHAQSLSSKDIGLAVEETALRGGAHGVIVTGETTGRSAASADLKRASEVARVHRIPLYLGSGATPQNVSEWRAFVDGVIIGSAIREGGRAGAALDASRAQSIRSVL